MIIKLLYREAGQNANSHAVIANAWQHRFINSFLFDVFLSLFIIITFLLLYRSDVFVSCAVFAGLSGSYMGYPFLDPLAGLLVSGVILKQVNFILINVLSALSDF